MSKIDTTKKAKRPTRASKLAAAKSSPKAVTKSSAASSENDWRVETLAEIRRLILEADPEIEEERKWKKPTNPAGVPVWSREGIICTGETYKQVVKLTFARGASLKDPQRLFNAGLDGNARRAIDIREGESLNAKAFQALIRAAVAENLGSAASKSKPASGTSAELVAKTRSSATKPTRLLSGGNPQIAKSDGDAPVQAYIAAMPDWKHDVGKRLDALIEQNVPNVRKAVKWNSPFYGVEGQGWFLSFHVFTRYVKVTFFNGTSLKPVPAGGTSKDARWIDLHEGEFDEKQLSAWIKQSAKLPGWLT